MKSAFKYVFGKSPYLSVLGELLKYPRITRKKANKIMQEVHKAFYGCISKTKRDSIVLLSQKGEQYFGISGKFLWTTSYIEASESYPISVVVYSDRINLANLMTGEILQREKKE